MSFTFDEAVAELATRNTIAQLFDLVRNTAATVASAAPGATSLLYAGTVNGESAVDLAKLMAPPGSTDLATVDNSHVGRLLFQSAEFKRKMSVAIRADLAERVPGFATLPTSKQQELVDAQAPGSGLSLCAPH